MTRRSAASATSFGSSLGRKRNLKTQLIICLCLATTVVVAEPAILHEQLQRAAEAIGATYLSVRGEITAQGKAVLPALRKAAEDSSLTWQQRLMARICCEWIERGAEIDALRRHDWLKDPEFDPTKVGSRAGIWADIALMGLFDKRFREARLWYWYAEMVWKRTGEYHLGSPRKISTSDGGSSFARHILRGEPEEYYVRAIRRDVVKHDPMLKTKEAGQAYSRLIEERRGEAVPELLTAFIASAGESGALLAQKGDILKQRFYRNGLQELLWFARPQDADLFAKYIEGRPYLDELKPAVDALRKRPPVPEPIEPPYLPGHQPK